VKIRIALAVEPFWFSQESNHQATQKETCMAKLTTKKRKSLSSKSFVFPKTRKFPIEDKAHARDALSRAAHKGGSVEAKVRAAVRKKYPGIGKKKGAGAKTRRRTKRR
jgi:hypothetical protein